ncbi:Hypothetical protein FKW44_019061, partial [Caligus rogercresseyi]
SGSSYQFGSAPPPTPPPAAAEDSPPDVASPPLAYPRPLPALPPRRRLWMKKPPGSSGVLPESVEDLVDPRSQ